MSNQVTQFTNDIAIGRVGERIFVEDFLHFLNIKYEDVTGNQGYQVMDADMLARVGLYEIKANYKDNKQVIIEEYTNINEALAPISMGWFYKSKADTLVFVSRTTRTMILLPFTSRFKDHYEIIKGAYELKRNWVSRHENRKWQSAYRCVPLEAISGYFAYYKLVTVQPVPSTTQGSLFLR